jgi:hypothetical protein
LSKVAIEGNASGTGTLTIAAPNTNTNRTLNLPDASGTMVITGGAQTIEFAAGTAGAPSITTTGDTNTGIYFPAADTIGFAEGGAQCGEFDSSANFKFNSGYGSVATAYGCRAWVNVDGNATPPNIRASGNISSVTRFNTGRWDINFSTALTDANYALGLSVQPSVSNAGSDTYAESLLAGSFRLSHFEDGTYRNSTNILIVVVR